MREGGLPEPSSSSSSSSSADVSERLAILRLVRFVAARAATRPPALTAPTALFLVASRVLAATQLPSLLFRTLPPPCASAMHVINVLRAHTHNTHTHNTHIHTTHTRNTYGIHYAMHDNEICIIEKMQSKSHAKKLLRTRTTSTVTFPRLHLTSCIVQHTLQYCLLETQRHKALLPVLDPY